MDTNDTTSSDAITQAHNKLDEILGEIRDRIETTMLDLIYKGDPITYPRVVAQIIMESFNDDSVDRTLNGKFDADMKKVLVEMADHMGPDWCQALYHAAVFMTKVA